MNEEIKKEPKHVVSLSDSDRWKRPFLRYASSRIVKQPGSRRGRALFTGLALLLVVITGCARWTIQGQSRSSEVLAQLEAQVLYPGLVQFELDQYLMKRVPQLPEPKLPGWRQEVERIRSYLLQNVLYHGWPREWIESETRFEDLGLVPSGKGYLMRKLRYEIVPGFYSTAILYEPEESGEKVPAILNVNGHVGPPGKAVEYKQKRCINYARRGMMALSLEWFYFGELNHPENEHWFGAHLDLVGANAGGLFYLAMRKGLDFLESHPRVDREALGVTGLSGGGWQTIVLSALDERVRVAVPVAGYSALISRIERGGSVGDIEQNATDMLVGQDYTHLTAMRAPGPTLLIYNNEDDCCFRAPLVKPYIFEAVRPFFGLMGDQHDLAWHTNKAPGDHNYQLENRVQSYRFFSKHFGLPLVEEEIPVAREIKTFEELVVGIPSDNLTILGLARQFARRIQRTPVPVSPDDKKQWQESQRGKLRELLRYEDVNIHHRWAIQNSEKRGITSESYRFEFSDRLSAVGVWLKSITSTDDSPATIILHDEGREEAAAEVSERLNRGEQVLVVDLIFRGEVSPPRTHSYTQLLRTVGSRPLGIQVSHLVALAKWITEGVTPSRLRMETNGIRSQTTGLIAAGLHPDLFSEVVIESGMGSLNYLLETPVRYHDAPDLFCLDLMTEFDIDELIELAAPSIINFRSESGTDQ